MAVSLATRTDPRVVAEVHDYLTGVFRPSNTTGHKVLMTLVAVAFVQGLILPPYLPETIVFGWVPLQTFVASLTAFELAIIGFFYARNRFDAAGPTSSRRRCPSPPSGASDAHPVRDACGRPSARPRRVEGQCHQADRASAGRHAPSTTSRALIDQHVVGAADTAHAR